MPALQIHFLGALSLSFVITTIGQNAPLVAGAGMSQEAIQTILIRLNRLEQNQTQMQVAFNTQISDMRNYIAGQFRVMNNNVRAYGGTIQGSLVRQRQSNRGTNLMLASQSGQAPPLVEIRPATLSNNPRSLCDLWREYEFGINGRKPAKEFTMQERNVTLGGTKQKWYRRSHFWRVMERLIRKGHDYQMAILKIRQVYGQGVSVTKILNGLIRDKMKYIPFDCHPNLR